MWIIVGLGNPGRIYRGSRHNLGFRVIDAISKSWHIHLKKEVSLKSIVGTGIILGRHVALAKPLTFMNLSGEAVGLILSKKRISTNNLLVVYDDIDLNFGTLRLRPKGGSAGHKGLGSVIKAIGTQDFARLRIGIGRASDEDITNYVLSRFSSEEERRLKQVLEDVLDCCFMWIKDGMQAAMGAFNRKARIEDESR